MDAMLVMPKPKAPVIRSVNGTKSDLLAELAEEALGAAGVTASYNCGGGGVFACLCSFQGDAE